MHVINVRNVHAALPEGVRLLHTSGELRETRNGPALVARGPVTTVYQEPTERVIFWAERDANPFFHLMEALWMLAGRNDTGFPCQFVKTMINYSDDGKTFHGAYGHRWRYHFGFDQLSMVAQALRDNPEDRRQVVQMWDATKDLGRNGKDLPCNTQVYFSRDEDGALDMTVCNRSNDVVWGAYGANAVHFSILQEYVAAMIGCEMGAYWQISNNFHGYLKTMEKVDHLDDQSACAFSDRPNPYDNFTPHPLVSVDIKMWDQDLRMFLDHPDAIGFRDPFFRRVAMPIRRAYEAYKSLDGAERFTVASEILQQCKADDWRLACEEWLERRAESYFRKAKAEDDGVDYDS